MSPDVEQRDHLERDRDPIERGARDGHEKRKKSGHTPQGEHHSSPAATRDPHDGWRGGQLRKTTGHGVFGPEEGPHTGQTTPGLGGQSTQDQRRNGLAW